MSALVHFADSSRTSREVPNSDITGRVGWAPRDFAERDVMEYWAITPA